jgi:hypothetical protein
VTLIFLVQTINEENQLKASLKQLLATHSGPLQQQTAV